MNIFRINNKYVAVAIFLMLAVTLQAQDYGALQYMLQKRPANEKFESNKFNEHLFFSAGIGPYSPSLYGKVDYSGSWTSDRGEFRLSAVEYLRF